MTSSRTLISAYKNMRRLRYGLHGIRGRKLNDLRHRFKDEFQSERQHAGNLATRYRKYATAVREENYRRRKARDNYLKILTYRNKQEAAFHRTKAKEGILRALQKHGALITAPLRPVPEPPEKELHSRNYFQERLDIFTSLERYIRAKLDELGDEWLYGDGTLPPAEQYERKRIKLAIGAPGKPYANKQKALAAITTFLHATLGNEDRLNALFERRKVPHSNAQAMETTRLAKLILGEMVRFPTSADLKTLKLYSDDRTVNKLASIILEIKHSISDHQNSLTR